MGRLPDAHAAKQLQDRPPRVCPLAAGKREEQGVARLADPDSESKANTLARAPLTLPTQMQLWPCFIRRYDSTPTRSLRHVCILMDSMRARAVTKSEDIKCNTAIYGAIAHA
uniref:Uncharacterized protein n=1 Tax=Coccidioides posadasii RMSCC 3488 TaxID=454284 RepID=A0A0J6FL78_COCPO|nr:hypothetical protein CPAG_07400 [Coccidioides posadasii RMSCC 3488]